MKIAIAMYGIPRASHITMPVIQKYFIDAANKLGECKVFYHLYAQTQVTNVRSGENTAMPADAYLPFDKFDGELEEPDRCLETWKFAETKQFGDHYNDDFRSIRNLIHQLHSMRQVTQKVSAWKPDLVLFLRPDLLYHRGFSKKEISTTFANPARCILPAWQWWGGYNDRFSLCGKNIFEAYGSRIELATDFSKSTGRPMQAERLVRFALQKANASVRVTSLQANRVRADGNIKPENFAATATAGSVRRAIEMHCLRALTQLSV